MTWDISEKFVRWVSVTSRYPSPNRKIREIQYLAPHSHLYEKRSLAPTPTDRELRAKFSLPTLKFGSQNTVLILIKCTNLNLDPREVCMYRAILDHLPSRAWGPGFSSHSCFILPVSEGGWSGVPEIVGRYGPWATREYSLHWHWHYSVTREHGSMETLKTGKIWEEISDWEYYDYTQSTERIFSINPSKFHVPQHIFYHKQSNHVGPSLQISLKGFFPFVNVCSN